MSELQAHQLAVDAPPGWEARIFRRLEAGDVGAADVPGPAAPMGEQTFPVIQVATIALPVDAADYGSDVVEDLGDGDVLIVLKEFDPASAATPLFARDGMPRTLVATDFDAGTLQRSLPGHGGHQSFFHEAGRAFSLYVVLGDLRRRAELVDGVNEVLASVRIDPLAQAGEAPPAAPDAPATDPPTTTVPPPTTTPPAP